MHSLSKAAVLALGLSVTSHALKATILADTNRDGKIDITGESDVEGKATWTDERGALFLPNIADTDGRCSKLITDAMTDKDIDKCHDASDNVQRNPKYLAPLRTAPNPDLTTSATGAITVSGNHTKEKVRIFHKNGDNWAYIDDKYVFKAADLQAGLELGIDARDVRRPNEWDGRVMVNFNLTDNGESAGDQVALRVAPILTHHHLQEPHQVFTANDLSPEMAQFASFIEKYTAKAGLKKPVYVFKETDRWAQDYFEPGYSSIPGPNGPVVLRVHIRSCQMHRTAGRRIFSELRSDTVGAVQHAMVGGSTDSTGNLETIPPHSYNGINYPAGRAVMGKQDNIKPHMLDFLEAQGAQHPIELDHDWLAVGHTDEYMQFLPANNSRGWVMTVDDPIAGLDILKKAQAGGHGKVQAMTRPHTDYDPRNCLPSNDIDSVLAIPDFEEVNKFCADRITYNIDIIKRETGISDQDIIRVPGVYYTSDAPGFDCKRTKPNATIAAAKANAKAGGVLNIVEAATQNQPLVARQTSKRRVVAFYPGTINGIVYANREYLAPNPWGPIINGKDIIATAVNEAYAKADFQVTYMDDWFDHHLLDGETHCGTNVARDASQKWW